MRALSGALSTLALETQPSKAVKSWMHLSRAALSRVAAEAALVHVRDLQPQQPGPQGDILVGKPVQQVWLITRPWGCRVQLCQCAQSPCCQDHMSAPVGSLELLCLLSAQSGTAQLPTTLTELALTRIAGAGAWQPTPCEKRP